MKSNLFIASCLMLLVCSCGNITSAISNRTVVNSSAQSPLVTNEIRIGKVSELEVSRAMRVNYMQGNSISVTVTAPQDIMEYLCVENDGTTLTCSVKKGYQIKSGLDRVVVNVTAPEITEFKVNTAGSLEVSTPIVLADASVEIDVSTAGSITISSLRCKELECESSTAGSMNVGDIVCAKELSADCSTGGVISLAGSASIVDFGASTGGVINATELKAYNGDAGASTGGVVNCSVAYLNKSASTGGAINNRN